MIRRLAIAGVLFAAGLAVLHFAIGSENFLNTEAGSRGEPFRQSGDARSGVVVGGYEGAEGRSPVAVSISGAGRFRRDVERTLPDGTVLFLPQWIVRFGDSETVDEDLVQLRDVQSELFRVRGEAAEATAHPVAAVHAREALVTIGRDDDGAPSIREDRDMELFDVEARSLDRDASGGDLHFEVGRLRARHSDDGLSFATPSPAEPFRATLDAVVPAVASGRGATGLLPARDRDGDVSLTIRSEPLVEYGSSTLRAAGSLGFREEPRSGAARLDLADRVRAESVDGGEPVVATADRLAVTFVLLHRRQTAALAAPAGQSGTARGIAPLELRVAGSPVRVRGAGLRLSCGELEAVPTPAGRPFTVSARGLPALVDERRGLSITAATALHALDPSALLADVHSAFGFAPLARWRRAGGFAAAPVIASEGSTTVRDDRADLDITASDGMRVQRAPGRDDLSWARGRGEVELRQRGLEVRGDGGCVAMLCAGVQTVELGPAEPDPAHHFALRQERDGHVLTLDGSGACRVVRAADGAVAIRIRSPQGDVALRYDDAELAAVETLDVRVRADGSLAAAAVRGAACTFALSFAGRRASGSCAELTLADASLTLTGPEGAELWRDAELVRGERIVVVGYGTDRAALRVDGYADGRPAFARLVEPAAPGGPAHAVELEARELRLVPGLVPAEVAAWHGMPWLAQRTVLDGWFVARGSAHLRRIALPADPVAAGELVAAAEGDRIDVLAAAGIATVRGLPARIEYLDASNGQRVRGRAHTIRALVDSARSTADIALLAEDRALPEVDLLGARERSGTERAGALRNVRAICDGAIRSTTDGLRFDGPVRLLELDSDGAVRTGGLDLAASEVRLDWDPETRALLRVRTDAGTQVALGDLRAAADRVDIDFTTSICALAGERNDVTVDLRGRRLRGSHFVVDYRRLELRAWNLRGSGTPEVAR
ncbi:MAG: hypothetical protein IPM29_31570 [Planctomycetes bacterium]|nr:hypothetical protein [Planctomycetota bacterium]